MQKITISADGKVHKEKWDYTPTWAWIGNRLLTQAYLLLFTSVVTLGKSNREYHIIYHSISERRLIYKAENGHSMRIYY